MLKNATITLAGTNGYYTPQFRTKTFDFTECMQRNSVNGGSYNVNGQPLYPQAPQMNNRPQPTLAIACGEKSDHPLCVQNRANRGSIIIVYP